MNDLEMTRLCAEAMGLDWGEELKKIERLYGKRRYGYTSVYNPLHDDAQAMALVKRFQLEITCGLHDVWIASNRGTTDYVSGNRADLNRAIVECVAKMQLSRATSRA